jgi:Xaa-Pro dipeptidase
VKYAGYTSDVTLTVAAGELTKAQERQIALVEKAYKAALALYRPGVATREASLAVDALFRKANRSMPHALGHGIGLEAHEARPSGTATITSGCTRPGWSSRSNPGSTTRSTAGAGSRTTY